MTIVVDWDVKQQYKQTNRRQSAENWHDTWLRAVMNIYTPCEDHIYEIELPKEIDIKSP